MKFRIVSLLCCLSIVSAIFSQKKISPDKVYISKPIAVNMPFMVDSVNLKGNKFGKKELLETSITLPKYADFTEELRADVASDYFFVSKPAQGARFHFMYFQLNADRYSKLKLKITSMGMYELYVNDKKELTKSTQEDSLKLAKVLDKDLSLQPGVSNFVIKYLSQSSSVAPEGVKISIEAAREDSLASFSVKYDGKRPPKVEDILEGTRVTNTSMAANGRFVLLSYRGVDNTGKITMSNDLFDTKTNRKISLGSKKTTWMPVSSHFYYTDKTTGKTRLISVDPETLSETVLCENIPSESFFIMPDEKSLLITVKESNDDRKGDLKLLGSPEDRQAGYYDRHFIYKFDLSTGLKQRLTFGRNSTVVNDVSLDSRYILYSIYTETVSESPFRNSSMFVLDTHAMKVDTLWTNEYYANSAKFSPDAKKILILGSANAFKGIGLNVKLGETANSYDTQAFIMDVASKQIEAITKNFDPSISRGYWSTADNAIYFRTIDKDYERIYRYNTQKKDFALLNLSEEVVRSFSLADNVPMASYSGLSIANSTRAYVVDLKNLKSTLISDPFKERIESLQLGQTKDWNFTASDGTLIYGRYYLPQNFDSSKKYPLIVYYYGGTTPVARTFDYSYPMHVYAALGYVVYVIQPSGAIGFGQDFSSRHVNAWGKRTADDIIEGTKQFSKEHGFVNDKKIGCLGASYGGFMTMYLQTRTDIFAAAISHAGISSISSYWGEGYWGYTYSSAASAGSYPWNNKAMYVEQSPLFNADKIHTPLLLMHGTEDTNVPIGESIQMYTALKILGRPAEFIQVKGENHGVTNYKKRIEWNHSMFAWFAKWLQNDPSWWNGLYPEKK